MKITDRSVLSSHFSTECICLYAWHPNSALVDLCFQGCGSSTLTWQLRDTAAVEWLLQTFAFANMIVFTWVSGETNYPETIIINNNKKINQGVAPHNLKFAIKCWNIKMDIKEYWKICFMWHYTFNSQASKPETLMSLWQCLWWGIRRHQYKFRPFTSAQVNTIVTIQHKCEWMLKQLLSVWVGICTFQWCTVSQDRVHRLFPWVQTIWSASVTEPVSSHHQRRPPLLSVWRNFSNPSQTFPPLSHTYRDSQLADDNNSEAARPCDRLT